MQKLSDLERQENFIKISMKNPQGRTSPSQQIQSTNQKLFFKDFVQTSRLSSQHKCLMSTRGSQTNRNSKEERTEQKLQGFKKKYGITIELKKPQRQWYENKDMSYNLESELLNSPLPLRGRQECPQQQQ